MTRPPSYIGPRLFAAIFLFDAALPLVRRVFPALPERLPHQQEAYFPHQVEPQNPAWQSHRPTPCAPILFAAAFSIPTIPRISGPVGALQPAVTLCENANSLKNVSRLSAGGSAAAPCAAEQDRLVKQSIWRLRASAATSALSESEAAAPTSVALSGVTKFRTLSTSTTAVSPAAGKTSTASAVTERGTASERPVGDGPSTVAVCALPSLSVAGEKTTSAEAPLHSVSGEAGSLASQKGSSTTAAAAREGDPEKAPSAAVPLGPVVTRKDLVASLTAELQLPRADVERTIAALLRHITANLEVGRKVSISKFGSFNVRRRGERVARNPRTGETLSVAAATFPTFSFSKVLKERVRDVVPINNEEGNEEEAEVKDEEQPQSEKKGKQLFSWS